MRYHMVLLPMVGILSLTACGGSSGASTTEPTEAQIRAEGAVPEALSLTSTSLVSEYIRDAAGSDVKFKGKTLELTGAVIDFGTNKENVAYVNLAGAGAWGGGPASVQCLFTEPGPKESFSELVRGQGLTLTGIFEGYSEPAKDVEGQFALFTSVGDIPTLSDCSVVK